MLKAAFPRSVCCDAFATGGCVHGNACECGWVQAPWPWMLHRAGGAYCDCHMESRAAWMSPAGIHVWPYFDLKCDLGHHMYPDSGPQRGDGL